MIDLRLPPTDAWQGTEDSLQIQCAAAMKKALYNAKLPQLGHHSANGGNRSAREGHKFKLMGVLPGVPDIFIPLKSEEYCGLYIELKNYKGKLAQAQIDFLTSVAAEDYLALVVNDLETFKRVVTHYLNQRNK